MEREVKFTEDGSKTLFIKELNEGYHSGHGALQEAKYVFIENGFKLVQRCEINILELGFGTGLNVLVTIDEFLKTGQNQVVNYFSLEKFPVLPEELVALEYPSLFENKLLAGYFDRLHKAPWGEAVEVCENFFVTKIEADFFDLKSLSMPPIDLVYFDCFGARVQPELWEMDLISLVANKMNAGGLFTTYSSKGSLRRALLDLSFEVEKKPGPPGKREMINARKL
ncbi:tRNA (5-methylaminomethyl-2-thiouridine)(34)-methyltransferase MnmD [Chryseobacterium sp. A301]